MNKKSEFNLSEKIHLVVREEGIPDYYAIPEEDVKEFIKQTIEDIEGGYEGEELINRIKKRAGEKLK